ncbi:MAG: radical SAM protein, partial [Bacillota bacterium]
RSAGGTLPVSVNVAVFNVAAARKFFEAGADRLGLAVDAATPSLFRRHKLDRPGAWRGRMELLEELARLYPGRISTHFIAGLGETEEEMVGAMYRAIVSGVTVALFAFTPVRGTLLEDRSAPDLASYRRMQLARFLMSERRARPEDFRFDEGAITAVGIEVAPEDLSRAFLTSGCPDCNRPYYNERPGETPYNYPRPPGWSEVVAAARAMGILYRIPEEFEEAKEVE